MNLPGFSSDAWEERFTLASTQEVLQTLSKTPRACLALIAQKARKMMAFNEQTQKVFVVAGYELAGVHGDNQEIWNQFKEQWQEKLNNSTQAMVVISTNINQDEEQLTKTDLVIIEKERISSLCFSSQDSDILWSDDGKSSPVPNKTYQ